MSDDRRRDAVSGLARSAVVAALVLLMIMAVVPTAGASEGPELTITGEPTEAERIVVEELWDLFVSTFIAHWVCLGPLEVTVVDRVEDVYGSTQSIAAFYQFPPNPIVFIEHGKVNTDNLMHEFAHHLDISCDLGNGAVGRAFLLAQGLPVDRPWLTGPVWSAVPAEMFAEAVVSFFGEEASIALTGEAVAVAAGVADTPAGYEVPPAMSGHFRLAGTPLQISPTLMARAFFVGVGLLAIF